MNRPDATPPNSNQWIQEAFTEKTIEPGSLTHPNEALLLDYVYDQLEPSAMSRLSAHIAKCEFCTHQIVSLRSELHEIEPALSTALESFIPQAEAHITSQVKEKPSNTFWISLRQKIDGWLGSRKVFLGHAVTYASAGAALLVIFIGTISDPLQSTSRTSFLDWVLRFLAVAWFVYFPILVIHGLRARK